MIKILFITLFVFLFYPESEWDLKKEKSGIEIYTRSLEGSSFDEFKGVTTIENCNLQDVLFELFDVENYDKLFPDCLNQELLKQYSQWHQIHYIQTKGPFPVKDRDSIFEQIAEIDETGKSALVTLKPRSDYIPAKKGIVRIPDGKGFWKLQEENNNVKVIYQFHGEPGGDVPAWLANSFVVSHPYKTLENLKKRIKTNNRTN